MLPSNPSAACRVHLQACCLASPTPALWTARSQPPLLRVRCHAGAPPAFAAAGTGTTKQDAALCFLPAFSDCGGCAWIEMRSTARAGAAAHAACRHSAPVAGTQHWPAPIARPSFIAAHKLPWLTAALKSAQAQTGPLLVERMVVLSSAR
jgi:hypothetical protein